jgi:hypothetical protein
VRDVRLGAEELDGFKVEQRVGGFLVEHVVRVGLLPPELVPPLGEWHGEGDVDDDDHEGDDAKVPGVEDPEVHADQRHLEEDGRHLEGDVTE